MRNRILSVLLLFAALASPLLSSQEARAQSACSSIAYGVVLTAAQWNACFSAKLDNPGFVPLNPANVLATTPIVASLSGSVVTISCPTCELSTGGNPTATAGPSAINGTSTNYMRSDAAPAIQKGLSSQFGIVECDNVTITCPGGVLTAVGSAASSIAAGVTTIADGNNSNKGLLFNNAAVLGDTGLANGGQAININESSLASIPSINTFSGGGPANGFQVLSDNSYAGTVQIATGAANSQTWSSLVFAQYGGTWTSPTASGSGVVIGNIVGFGYTGSAFSQGSQIIFKTTQAWTGTNGGSSLLFYTVPNGTHGGGSGLSTLALTLGQDLSATFAGNVSTSGSFYAGASKGVTCTGALTVISSVTITDGIVTAATGTGGTCS